MLNWQKVPYRLQTREEGLWHKEGYFEGIYVMVFCVPYD
jgi:hypothetical protein